MKTKFPTTILLVATAFAASCSFKPIQERLLSENSRTRQVALKQLKALPPASREKIVAPMIAALSSDQSRISNRAAEALVVIGDPAVDDVIRVLDSKDPFVRILGVSILGDIGARPDEVLPELVARLDDQHPLVREEAAHAIGEFGTVAIGAGPALIQTLNDPQPEVRDAVREALKNLGMSAPGNLSPSAPQPATPGRS